MFTGFASENTPAIQVWEFGQTISSNFSRIALADDCSPIQIFKTGGQSAIVVYLPSSPIEGKQIKIINAGYVRTNRTEISIYAPDIGSTILTIGAGQTIDFCYSKNFISSPASIFNSHQTGWITLNQSPASSAYYHSVILGGSGSTIQEARAAVISGVNNSARGAQSGVFVGSTNVASGTNSTVIGGSNATASADSTIVLGATSSTANNTQSIVVGGESNTSQGFRSAVIGGNINNVSGNNSITLGCNNSTANSNNSSVLGGSYGSTRSIVGYTVFPGTTTIAVSSGVTQTALSVLGKQTTDATSGRLTSNGSASGGTTNQVILPNNSAYYVKGSIIATVTGGGNTKSWDFIATIKRGANAAATSIVGAVTLNVQAADAGASTWVVAITADTTNGGLAVTVTGQAATTIRWVAKLESTEVTY